MLAYAMIGTNDLENAIRFYDAVLAPLGFARSENDDGYVGYAEATALCETVEVPSHWVRVPRSHVYPAPDEKAPPLGRTPAHRQLRPNRF